MSVAAVHDQYAIVPFNNVGRFTHNIFPKLLKVHREKELMKFLLPVIF